MERSFSADFSDVRVHEGAEAPAPDALAHTRGSHLHFAPGRYQPESEGGQALLGHKLAHVVQQRAGRVAAPVQGKGASINADPALEAEADAAGARAARGEPAQVSCAGSDIQAKAGGAIQRAIGFDFELTSWSSAKSNKALRTNQRSGAEDINVSRKRNLFQRLGLRQSFVPIGKGETIVWGNRFELQGEDVDGASGIELVTDHSQMDERPALLQTVQEMINLCNGLVAARGDNQDAKVTGNDLGGFGTVKRPNAVMWSTSGAIDAKRQATIGVDLGGLGKMAEQLGKKLDSEGGGDTARRQAGRDALMSGAQGTAAASLRDGSAGARSAIAAYVNEQRDGDNNGFGSAQLQGLLSLVCSYLLGGAAIVPRYPKAIVSLMARTNFPTMFAQLPEKDELAAHDGQGWLWLAGRATGLDLSQPFFALGVQKDATEAATRYRYNSLTRAVWLRGMTKGRDYLSAQDFPKIGRKRYARDLESLGSHKKKMDVNPASGQRDLPILEPRNMAKLNSTNDWIPMVKQRFAYVDALLAGRDETYGEANVDGGEGSEEDDNSET